MSAVTGGWRVRGMRPEDVATVVQVQCAGAVLALAAVFDRTIHPFDGELVGRRWHRELADPATAGWVLTDAGRVAGFAAVRDDELLHLGTHPDTWGTGAAQVLRDAVVAGAGPGEPVVRRLWVYVDNPRARRFYARLGWLEDGRCSVSTVPPHPPMIGLSRPEARRRLPIARPDAANGP